MPARSETRFAVLGAGAYGSAIGAHLARMGHPVAFWRRGENLEAALTSADVLILGVPAQAMRGFLSQFETDKPVVSLAKGIEAAKLKRMSEVVRETLGNVPYAVLSGPSFAKDVTAGNPVGLTLASKDKALRERLQSWMNSDVFDVKTTDDVAGVEIGGALKNVFAIGAGILDGCDVGDSMAGDWFTRCMVEMREVGQVIGGRWETFGGRSGLGDLVITCTDSSRNFRFGQAFARHGEVDAALTEVGATVEGVKTLEAVHRITQDKGMMTPIIHTLHRTVHSKELSPAEFLPEIRRLDAKRAREGASTGSVVMRRLLPRLWYRRRGQR